MSGFNRVVIIPEDTGPNAPVTPADTAATATAIPNKGAAFQTKPAPPQDDPKPVAPAQPVVPTARPTWLPEKFKSPEDMAAAYAALEKKQGTTAAPAKPAEEATPKPEGEAAQVPEGAPPGLTQEAMQSFSSEYAEHGELKPESYTKLEAAGIPRQMVDAYIAGQQAIAQQQVDLIHGSVGGADAYGELIQWAVGAMQPTEIEAYNAAVQSGNLEQARLAVSGLKARYDAANGSPAARQVMGNPSSRSNVPAFQSTAQLTAAMRDPRYKVDPAYREEVAQRLAASSVL